MSKKNAVDAARGALAAAALSLLAAACTQTPAMTQNPSITQTAAPSDRSGKSAAQAAGPAADHVADEHPDGCPEHASARRCMRAVGHGEAGESSYDDDQQPEDLDEQHRPRA